MTGQVLISYNNLDKLFKYHLDSIMVFFLRIHSKYYSLYVTARSTHPPKATQATVLTLNIILYIAYPSYSRALYLLNIYFVAISYFLFQLI